MTNIAKALLSFQVRAQNAFKSATNPQFKSKYAKLEDVLDAVREDLSKAGIVFTQIIGRDEHGAYLETHLIHAETGETLKSVCPLLLPKNDMQAAGSAITYARRYSLAAICGIAQEDDDGNAASQPVSEGKKRQSSNEELNNRYAVKSKGDSFL